MLDLSCFKIKGKTFVYHADQFNKPSYTAVCTICCLVVESKCKIHNNKEKHVVCEQCGCLMCWKTWTKTHSQGCCVIKDPMYNEVVRMRAERPNSEPIEMVVKRKAVPNDYSPAKRPKFDRDYLPMSLFDNVIVNRFSQVLPSVESIRKHQVNGVVVFCRYCYLIMHSASELCPDHNNTAKKYTDINKYICLACGQIMSYSTFKRHFKNGKCKLFSDSKMHCPITKSTTPNPQLISSYPEIHPYLQPYLHLLLFIGEDFLLLLNDLCSTHSDYIAEYCCSIESLVTRFMSSYKVNTDFDFAALSKDAVLDILNTRDDESIFEPLSPISIDNTSSISLSSIDALEMIPTNKKINEIFNPAVSVASCSTLSDLELPDIEHMPKTTTNLVYDRMLFLIEELMLLSLEFYKVYTLFQDTLNRIMNETTGNLNTIKKRLIDLNFFINKKDELALIVLYQEFDFFTSQQDIVDQLKQKRVQLENVLIECEHFTEKSKDYLTLVDFLVGRKITVATHKMLKLSKDVSL